MPKIPNKSITKQDKLENILKYNLKARIESDHWQDAYDYMDSAKMYDDVRAAGITQEDLNKIELDATDLKEYILDTFMHLKRFKFKDSESYDYAKSICRQLGLDEVDNPFITLFKALPDVLSKKDIIALNNAYSRRYISDNMLKYNKPDKSGAPNILYNTGLYKNNSGASDIINILKASEDFTVSNKEDLKHYLNIFYTDDQVNPWYNIKRDLEDYNGAKSLAVDTDQNKASRTLSRLSQKDLTTTITNELNTRAGKDPEYVSNLIGELLDLKFKLQKKAQ